MSTLKQCTRWELATYLQVGGFIPGLLKFLRGNDIQYGPPTPTPPQKEKKKARYNVFGINMPIAQKS